MGHKKKLMIAALSMLMSVTVLATASFAWFTLSTNPEIKGMQVMLAANETVLISDDSAETFHFAVDISDDFGKDLEMNTLRPVSTIDGLNWYVCDYNTATGDIWENQFYEKDWCVSTEHGKEGHVHCDNGGFYAYTDVWVKTESSTPVKVRLSIPHSDGADKNDEIYGYYDETASGSYVLTYDALEEADGDTLVKILSKGPETCARVGMMIFKPTDEKDEGFAGHVVLGPTEDAATLDSDQIESFFIYEPNADVRSELDKSSRDYLTDVYVSSWRAWQTDYRATEGSYVPTFPIKAGNPSTKAVTIQGAENEELGDLVVASPALFDPEKLIVQTGTYWDADAIKNASASTENLLTQRAENLYWLGDGSSSVNKVFSYMMLNSYIKYAELGKFIRNEFVQQIYTKATTGMIEAGTGFITGGLNENYPDTALTLTNTTNIVNPEGVSQILFTLEKGQVRQIRLYFWIEGQDIDCWNDVAGMNFIVRLEFATHEE